MLNTPEENKSNTSYIIIFSILVVIVIAAIVSLDLDKIKTLIVQAGPWGLLISISIYAILGLTFVPSEPVTLLIGALFGPWTATLVAGLGNTLAALVEYVIGERLGTAANFDQQKEKLPFGLSKLPVTSPIFLIFARMIPGFGPKAVSILSGVYRVPIILYLWTAALATFVGAMIFAFGGFGLNSIFLP